MEVFGLLALLGIFSLAFVIDDPDESSNDDDAGDGEVGDVAGVSDAADDDDAGSDVNFIQLTDDNDVAEGTDGDDQISALAGDDVVTGGDGDDLIFLGEGDDESTEDTAGDDFIRGGAGNDLIVDDQGANTLFGDLGNDVLSGLDESNDPSEADVLFGGFAGDVLFADEGDVVTGGGDDDTFVISFANDGAPTTITDYEAGDEILLELPFLFTDTELEIAADEAGENTLINIGGQTAVVLEGITDADDVNITLGASDGSLTPSPNSDFVLGTEDDDTVDGGLGKDIIYGGAGEDDLAGGSLSDAIYGGDDSDIIAAGAANDFLFGGNGDDVIEGGAGDDLIIDSQGADSVQGDNGDDILDFRDDAAGGADIVRGGIGNDFVLVDDGDNVRLGPDVDLAVISVESVADAPVTFADFDPSEDRLELAVGDGTGVLAVTPLEDGSGVSVTVDSQEVAILTGSLALTGTPDILVVPLDSVPANS